MQRITITPSDINPESLDVNRDGTRLGIICRDICNGRIQYGTWSLSPDQPNSFAGRYDSVEEAVDAIAATWPTVEQPTGETPAQATTDTAAVFTAAAAATARWTRTNCGDRTEVSHGGYRWTVERPTRGGPARIIGRHSWGGTENLDVPDTTPAPAVEPGPLLASERLAARLTDLIS